MSDSPFLASVSARFASHKALAERAIAQVSEEQLHAALSPESNSVAVLMQHMSGNLASRWTDFLTKDGEKVGRNRDAEFRDSGTPKEALLEAWERGWQALFTTLSGMTDADLSRRVTIRGESHTVLDSIVRQLAHYGYHVGQIVFICRLHTGESWRSLSIGRGDSDSYNRALGYAPPATVPRFKKKPVIPEPTRRGQPMPKEPKEGEEQEGS